jgi:hypothetical protein
VKDLKPLMSSDATDFERELLGAVAQERPSPELQLRMQQAIGIAPLAFQDPAFQGADTSATRPELSGTHAAIKAGASKWVGGTFLKAALGVGVGAGLVAGGFALSSKAPAPSAPVPAMGVAVTANSAPVSPAVAPPVSTANSASAENVVPSAENTVLSRELREEIELLDQVRTALGQKDAAAASTLLDDYSARFPSGKLAREAGVLRARTAQAVQSTSPQAHPR